MSKPTLSILLALLAAFSAYMTFMYYDSERFNRRYAEACLKPAQVPSVEAVFYFPPGKPVMGVMTR
jgi:hypothetical protein